MTLWDDRMSDRYMKRISVAPKARNGSKLVRALLSYRLQHIQGSVILISD